MNGLLAEMRRSMEQLQLGLDGALNMSPAMEQLLAAIAAGRVPPSWMAQMSTRIQVGRGRAPPRAGEPVLVPCCAGEPTLVPCCFPPSH